MNNLSKESSIVIRWKYFISMSAIVLLSLTTGCASMFSGSTQQIAFDSNPNKSDVYVDGAKVCVTPCVTMIRRDKIPPRIEIKKEGYEDGGVALGSRMNYWVFGDFFWSYFSTTAFAVDLTTNKESSIEYDPGRYFITLEPLKKTSDNDNKDTSINRSSVLSYIAITHAQLAMDISRGAGEHLEALYSMLGVKSGDQSSALAKLQELSIAYSDTMVFARAVDDAFSDHEKTKS